VLEGARSTLQQREVFIAVATSQLQIRQAAVEQLTRALVRGSCRVDALQSILKEKDTSIVELQ
jgi:hypothetical protein